MSYSAVKAKLDPTPQQIQKLLSHAGAARFVYNQGLDHVKKQVNDYDNATPEEQKNMSVDWSYYSLRLWWNKAKYDLAPDWWPENSKEAYNSGLENLGNALKNFSKSRKGERKGKRVGFPKYKSRNYAKQSFTYTTGMHIMGESDPYGIHLPKIGRVHCFENVYKRVDGRSVSRMTISMHNGCWYASLLCKDPDDEPVQNFHLAGAVGIDLGIKELAVLSDGTFVRNPKWLRQNEKKLAHDQRLLAHCKKGSNNFRLRKRRLEREYAHIANERKDYLEKLTTFLVTHFRLVCIEDLNVAGMVKNHNLAQSIEDASFSEFRRELTYKAQRTGCTVVPVDRWYPSSKRCCRCGWEKTNLTLADRTFRCENCGLVIDRDLNAAINLLIAGSTSVRLTPDKAASVARVRGWVNKSSRLESGAQIPVRNANRAAQSEGNAISSSNTSPEVSAQDGNVKSRILNL